MSIIVMFLDMICMYMSSKVLACSCFAVFFGEQKNQLHDCNCSEQPRNSNDLMLSSFWGNFRSPGRQTCLGLQRAGEDMLDHARRGGLQKPQTLQKRLVMLQDMDSP